MSDKKTSKEIVAELVDLIFNAVSKEQGAQAMMLRPALNVVKLKMAQMSDEDSDNLIDKVHFISHHIEVETGILSPYHGIDD